MLIVATAVFLYYTIWTLLMVWDSSSFLPVADPVAADTLPAIRRRGPPTPQPLPTPRVGYPHPGHPHTTWVCRCWFILVRGHDKEQQEEGIEGEAGEEGIDCWLGRHMGRFAIRSRFARLIH